MTAAFHVAGYQDLGPQRSHQVRAMSGNHVDLLFQLPRGKPKKNGEFLPISFFPFNWLFFWSFQQKHQQSNIFLLS